MKNINVGDDVLIEQAWQSEDGHYHDVYATVSKILPDGYVKFRIRHWKTRKQNDQKLQAYLNQQEWRIDDLQKA